jgi:hypothetical protein
MVVATDVTLPATGAFMGVAMVSAQTIEMTGDEFTDYLKEEGLRRLARQDGPHGAPAGGQRGRVGKLLGDVGVQRQSVVRSR